MNERIDCGPGLCRPLDVEILKGPDSFDGLREDWRALLETSESDTPFLTWEWLHTWWRHLRGRRRLRLVAVRSGGRLVGLAPLAARVSWLGGLAPVRTVEFLGTGIVGSDYLDVMAQRGFETEVVGAVADVLARGRERLELRQVKAEGSLAPAVGAALLSRGWTAGRASTDVAPYIRLGGHSWDSFLGTLGPEHRYNVRRRIRKLEGAGTLRLERAATQERRRELLRLLWCLHSKRWASRGGSEALDSPRVEAFHEEFTRLALDRGWLRLHVLWLGDAPVAALYGLSYRERFYFYQSGFDPAFAPLSVGLVSLALAIRGALEERAREFDLLHGNETYKSLWTREARGLVRVDADPPGALPEALRYLTRTLGAARRTVRRALPLPVAARVDAFRKGFRRAVDVAAAR